MSDPTVIAHPSGSVAAAIGWFYLVTNSARVITYIPQIVAVWRCRDGAHAISLLTWGSWLVSHATAIAYGALVVGDPFFVAISAINFTGCVAVTLIAAYRRGLLGKATPSGTDAAAPVKATLRRTSWLRRFSAWPRQRANQASFAAMAPTMTPVSSGKRVVDPTPAAACADVPGAISR